MISYFNEVSFICVTGIILFANKNAMPDKKSVKINKGRMNLTNEMPAALMAINSKLSPKFPKVIMEENNNANGNAVVKVVADTKAMSCKMVNKSRPLPTRSSI
jgi:hypothetical protein